MMGIFYFLLLPLLSYYTVKHNTYIADIIILVLILNIIIKKNKRKEEYNIMLNKKKTDKRVDVIEKDYRIYKLRGLIRDHKLYNKLITIVSNKNEYDIN